MCNPNYKIVQAIENLNLQQQQSSKHKHHNAPLCTCHLQFWTNSKQFFYQNPYSIHHVRYLAFPRKYGHSLTMDYSGKSTILLQVIYRTL